MALHELLASRTVFDVNGGKLTTLLQLLHLQQQLQHSSANNRPRQHELRASNSNCRQQPAQLQGSGSVQLSQTLRVHDRIRRRRQRPTASHTLSPTLSLVRTSSRIHLSYSIDQHGRPRAQRNGVRRGQRANNQIPKTIPNLSRRYLQHHV